MMNFIDEVLLMCTYIVESIIMSKHADEGTYVKNRANVAKTIALSMLLHIRPGKVKKI